MSCGFFPALDKAGWCEAPGWFEAVIPQPGSDSYSVHRKAAFTVAPSHSAGVHSEWPRAPR